MLRNNLLLVLNHNALFAYMIPSMQSFRVLYEASHFCNICDITPKLPMTSVADRLNDLCKVTHQFRCQQNWKHYGHYNYLTLKYPFSFYNSMNWVSFILIGLYFKIESDKMSNRYSQIYSVKMTVVSRLTYSSFC